ncbi:hypothetical protein PYCC9005_005050 [Savitreella phatthalungensis]
MVAATQTKAATTTGTNTNAVSTGRQMIYTGHAHLRRRLVLATIAGKTIRIDKIRPLDANPGLRDYEISFLRLLERFTNGSLIEISYTGTTLLYKPGQITGGVITHDCKGSRAIGYFLEPLLPLAPIAKSPVNLTLTGITSCDADVGVDVLRTSVLPVLRRFLGEDGGSEDGKLLELRLLKRGASPGGGGQVQLMCPVVRVMRTIHLLTPGRINRIRGFASSTRVSPANVNRLVTAARAVLNPFVSDIHIYTDARRGDECGNSPGFGLALAAETSAGCVYASEVVAGAGEAAEEVGEKAAKELLVGACADAGSGCVDLQALPLALTCMLLGTEDVGRLRVGQGTITPSTVQLLRDIKHIFNRTVAITEEPKSGTLLLSVVGIGHVNVNKGIS